MTVARLVLPALRWRRATGFAHERATIAACLGAGVGGFIVFGGTRDQVGRLARELRAQAGRPLLIGGDFERGVGQQVTDLTELPPPAALGAVDDTAATREAAAITAREARSAGFNWAFAPVADLDLEPRNPIVQTRAFGADPAAVAGHVAAWIEGCQREGVLATAKHYPGHGRTTQDSHETLPLVAEPLEVLQRADLVPFGAAVRAGVRGVMAAFVAFPALDPSGAAAGFSRPIIAHLRKALGFDGLLVSDAFIMAGATAAELAPRAAVTAIAAGCDLLLYPDDPLAVVAALSDAVGSAVPRDRVDEAVARYDEALAWAGRPPGGEPDVAAHARFADRLADRALRMVRGSAPSLRSPVEVLVVDDDVGGPYAVGPRDVFTRQLAAQGLVRPPGSRIVLVYSEPRSWKGRASLGERSLMELRRLAPGADLVVLFGHPRLMREIPGEAPVVCGWHGQALMQRAAGRWVEARIV